MFKEAILWACAFGPWLILMYLIGLKDKAWEKWEWEE